ncbi:MAG: hypothetical protein ACK5XF_00195 [Neisseriaceae bacterium]
MKIYDNFGITLHKSVVHQIMKNLPFSYITPRARHYSRINQNMNNSKNLFEEIKIYPESAVFF